MALNNPYVELVNKDTDILIIPEDIYSHQGKWGDFFGNTNPIILEIGTGMGNFFGRQCGRNKNSNFIGMEIRFKRLYTTAEKGRNAGNNNFVVLKDLGQNIGKIFKTEEISETYIFFPDPYCNKKKQLKHRLFQEDFLKNLHNITQKGGKVFFKTDHKGYFDDTMQIIQQQGIWNVSFWTHDYETSEVFSTDNITEFEGMYRGENIKVNYMELVK